MGEEKWEGEIKEHETVAMWMYLVADFVWDVNDPSHEKAGYWPFTAGCVVDKVMTNGTEFYRCRNRKHHRNYEP